MARRYGFDPLYKIYPDGPTIYQRNLEIIGRLCQSYGIKVVYLFQPTISEVRRKLGADEVSYYKAVKSYSNWFDIYMEMFPRYFQAMRTAAQMVQAPCVDTNAWLKDALNGQNIFIDDCHLNVTGNTYYSNRLADYLEPLVKERLAKLKPKS